MTGKGVGKGLARIRCAAVLAILAALGWGLSGLRQPGEVRDVTLAGGGEGLWIWRVTVRGGSAPGNRAQWIFSRVPVHYDPGRSILTFSGDGSRLVVPPGFHALLVPGLRRLDPLFEPPLAPLLEARLLAAPRDQRARELRAWSRESSSGMNPGVQAFLRSDPSR